jgi:propionyl-CoA carboxylase beta chain
VAALLDEGSAQELGAFASGASEAPGDGVVCALGRVAGRPVAVYAHDATVLRGSLGAAGARKVARLLDLALEQGIPVVALHDCDGARVAEGPAAIAGFAEVMGRVARLSGWVPQIGVVLGLCVGGAAYSAALEDFVVGHREQGYLFVTGASVTEAVTGQHDPLEELGGVAMHAARTGLVQLVADDERACLALARELLSFLPANAGEAPPRCEPREPPAGAGERIAALLPQSDRRAYDMRRLVRAIVDGGAFLELGAGFARSLLVGLARLAGRPLGVVASQPLHAAGCLDRDASRKGARFVQLCNAYGLPVVTLVDVPGFLPGRVEEQGGLLLHGAKLIAAYAACEVPLVSLIVRKSYGGGNVLAWPADVRLAYPFARVQPMGSEAALAVASRAALGGASPEELAAFRAELARAHERPLGAAEAGLVDRVIRPGETRLAICAALEALAARPRRRGLPPRRLANIPL